MPDANQIVFVCTGNTCRSPMAEALYNHFKTHPDWSARSCGLAAFDGEPATEHAIGVMMADYQIDLSHHQAQRVSRECLAAAKLVLTMTTAQRDHLRRLYPDLSDKILTLGEYADEAGLSIPDPYERGFEFYRITAGTLARIIKKIIAKTDESSNPDVRQDHDHPV